MGGGIGSHESVRLLLAAGADPDLEDRDGRSPRAIAQKGDATMKALLPTR